MKSPSKQKQQRLSYNNPLCPQLRTSIFKLNQRASDFYKFRNTLLSSSLLDSTRFHVNDFRGSNFGDIKKKQMEMLRQTLSKLEDRVNEVKERLQLPQTMKKNKRNLVHYQDASEEKLTDKEQPTITGTDSSITLKNSDRKLTQLINNKTKPINSQPINTNPYSLRKRPLYYISEAIHAVNEKNSRIVDHINQSIKIIKQCQGYEIPSLSEMTDKKLYLKKSEYYKKKKTLVLDLDETIIHCVDNYEAEADIKVNIKLGGQELKLYKFGVNIRPYGLTFLRKMAKKFEIIAFTAAQQQVTDAILDELDPDKEIFQHRIYRQHCWVLENQMHVKDIRIINRNLSDMVLIDNSASSYSFQLENGIPILPYFQGCDYELPALEAYLNEVQKASDVRELNKQTFKLHHYTNFPNAQQLIKQLYINKSS